VSEESRQARCPYCRSILDPVFVEPYLYRFPDHRGHGGMRCAGWWLPVVERDYVTEGVAG
jgi:hypothetical protein